MPFLQVALGGDAASSLGGWSSVADRPAENLSITWRIKEDPYTLAFAHYRDEILVDPQRGIARPGN